MTIYLGLTGGIASGKTSAANFFRQHAYPVIDADQVSHSLMKPGQANYQGLIDAFGQEILADNGEISRKRLGQIVFADQAKLELLNSIVQANIRKQIIALMRSAKSSLVVVDLPLLFEQNWQSEFTYTLLISVPKKLQVERLMKRNNLSKVDALSRIDAQMPLTNKRILADYVIDNSASKADLQRKLSEFLMQIRKVEDR